MRSFFLLLALSGQFLAAAHTFIPPRGTPGEVLALINDYRAQNGLPALAENPILSYIAQAQADYLISQPMGTVGDVHEGPGGSRPKDRAYAAGYGGGENISVSEIVKGGIDETPSSALAWWKTSPPHNNTMLTTYSREIGAGAATDLLARKEAKTLAIFGAGKQARTQLEAACTVRRIKTVWVYDLNTLQAQELIADLAGKDPVPNNLRLAGSPSEAVKNADIISTATTSPSPVFPDSSVKPGTHINAVGAYTPQTAEVPEETVARARVFVDSLSACKAEAGEIVQPLAKGLIHEDEIGELGKLINGQAQGRTSDEQVTLFKSVGVAVQDAFAGQLALTNARRLGIGTEVAW